jgi:DNA-binding transcriptional regulator YhcF (GntR family)
MLDDGAPLFQQIAEQLSSEIVDGTLPEGGKVPSTNEFAAFYRINPATAAKGINLLVDEGILEKRRGIGMFVVTGAQDRLINLRRKEFAEQFVDPLVTEARRIGIDTETLIEMIRRPPDRRRGDRIPDQADHGHGLTTRDQPAPVSRTATTNRTREAEEGEGS